MGCTDRVRLSVATGCLSDRAGLLNVQVTHRDTVMFHQKRASGTCVLAMTGMTLK